VSGDPELVDRVVTKVVGGNLRIETPSHFHPKQQMRVSITTPDLEAVTLSGAGTISVAGLASKRFAANVPGSGELRLSGATDKLSIAIGGAGKIGAEDLAADAASIDIAGTGEVRCTATRAVAAAIAGVGHVVVEGHPQMVSKSVRGIGTIEVR
jgi:hypothetical protein